MELTPDTDIFHAKGLQHYLVMLSPPEEGQMLALSSTIFVAETLGFGASFFGAIFSAHRSKSGSVGLQSRGFWLVS